MSQLKYQRAKLIDQNFTKNVKESRLPQPRVRVSLSEAGISPSELVDLFESQMMSRALDIRARELKEKSACFYTISSSGHEGNAAYGKVFRTSDMAFLHYRSGAFMIQRSKQNPAVTPLYNGLLSLVASSDDPISGGRHRVYGSLPLMVPPQTSTIASHLPKAVGAALSIPRARDLKIKSEMPKNALVTCSFGDASLNHASAQTAINTAANVSYRNMPLPLVFICEDNGIGISVPTAEGWVEQSISRRPGLRYMYADGLNLLHASKIAKEVENYVRVHRKPVFLHVGTIRLLGHAGSDPEWNYHSWEHIESVEAQDPLLHSARLVIENGILSADEVCKMYESVKERVRHISDYAVTRPKLETREQVKASVLACKSVKSAPATPEVEARKQVFGKEFEKLEAPQHLAKLLNYSLRDVLLQYPQSVVFGEDVAQKGGVYNVTDGLHKSLGPRRVFNSPLDETSILGSAIGMGHNGFLPIPEIQFLAYVHNAEDQIRGEAATLPFFSQGQYTNPMVIRIAGLPYQKGFGGHFHNDNSLAVFRDIPGLMIAVPSRGDDAARMLRACVKAAYEQGRVVVFIEPIALYMTKDLHEPGDKAWSFKYPDAEDVMPIGEVGVTGKGKDLCILTYGNGNYLSIKAQKILADKHKVNSKVVDLRWIAPINWGALFDELKGCSKVLVVDECRKTGSLSEALVSGLIERMEMPPQIAVEAADDCFIPLGVAAASGLPSVESIIEKSLSLVGKK